MGKRVRVYWPKDDQYYAGTVVSYRRETTGKWRHLHTIDYDDDGTETLNLCFLFRAVCAAVRAV